MAVPLNLKDIQSGFLSASTFNENNTLTEEALAKTLNRTSNAVDNAMEVNLDMGLNNIFNLKDAFLGHEATNLSQVQKLIQSSSSGLISRLRETRKTAADGQTVFNLADITYTPGVNNIMVYVNGVAQVAGIDYAETDSTTITFLSALEAGDVVDVYVNEATTNSVTDAQNVAYGQSSNVAEALDKRTIFVGTVSDLSSIISPSTGQEVLVSGVPFKYDGLSWNPSAGYVTPEVYGAVGDGVTDDTAALNSTFANSNVLFPYGKTYLFTSNITVSVDSVWVGYGAKLLSTSSGITFQGSSGSYEVLSVAVSKFDDTFTFSGSTAEGDLVKVYIDLANSWLDSDPSSKLGDIYEVESDGVIKNFFEFDFPATDSKIKKIEPITVDISGLSVETSNSTNSFRLLNCKNSVLRSMNIKNSTTGWALSIKECFNTRVEETNTTCLGSPAGFEYGIVLDETKKTHITGGRQHGTRHGVATGSSGTGITNDTVVEYTTISNDPDLGIDLFSADMHGESQDTTYRFNKIFSGVALAGRNAYCYSNIIYAIGGGSTYSPLRFTDVEGGTYDIRDNTILMGDSGAQYSLVWTASARIPYVRTDLEVDYSDNRINVNSSFDGAFSMTTNGDNPYLANFTYKVNRNHVDGDLSGMIRFITQSEAGTGSNYEVKEIQCLDNTFGEAPISTFVLFRVGGIGSLGSTHIKVRGVTKVFAVSITSGTFQAVSNQALPYGVSNIFASVQCNAYIEENAYNGNVFPFAYGNMTSATNADLRITSGNQTETFGSNDALTAVYNFYLDRVGI